MEVNYEQRANLAALQKQFVGQVYRRDATRPSSMADYHLRVQRLESLQAVWSEIDQETQQHIVIALANMWEAATQFPDMGVVIATLLGEMEKMPGGRPEHYPGLGEATALLWSIWCVDRASPVAIDREACHELGMEIADLFGIAQADAARRVRSVLHSLDRENKLPNRKGYGT